MRLSTKDARVCLDVFMQEHAVLPVSTSFAKEDYVPCPFPYIRARISGDAIVNVPMTRTIKNSANDTRRAITDRSSTQSSSSSAVLVSSGCALLPIAGKYFLDMNLLHCTMNAGAPDATSDNLRKNCPLQPRMRHVKNFTFHVPSFVTSPREMSLVSVPHGERKNVFPYRAWIYAPRCKNTMMDIGPHCTAAATSRNSSIIRTAYQTIDRVPFWNNQGEALDDYLWLPVNLQTGEPNYQSFYSVPKYAPPLRGLNNATNFDVVCFLGDSHVRYLSYLTKMIFYNATWGKDGCNDKHLHTGFIGPDVSQQFRYFKMEYSKLFLGQNIANVTANFQSCNLIVILFGHWHAGTRKYFTVPAKFASAAHDVMERLQNVTPSSTRIYLASTDASPVGFKLLECTGDWRTPAMVDVYNAFLRKNDSSSPINWITNNRRRTQVYGSQQCLLSG